MYVLPLPIVSVHVDNERNRIKNIPTHTCRDELNGGTVARSPGPAHTCRITCDNQSAITRAASIVFFLSFSFHFRYFLFRFNKFYFYYLIRSRIVARSRTVRSLGPRLTWRLPILAECLCVWVCTAWDCGSRCDRTNARVHVDRRTRVCAEVHLVCSVTLVHEVHFIAYTRCVIYLFVIFFFFAFIYSWNFIGSHSVIIFCGFFFFCRWFFEFFDFSIFFFLVFGSQFRLVSSGRRRLILISHVQFFVWLLLGSTSIRLITRWMRST